MGRKASFVLIFAMLALVLAGCQSETPTPVGRDAEPLLQFAVPKDALADMKSTPVGTDPWQLYYAGPEYVYLTYNFGTRHIFRYNVKENTIDKAMDTGALFPAETRNPHSANCAFTADGRYAVVIAGLAPEDKPPRSPVYKVDFDQNEISVLADGSEGFTAPPDFAFLTYEEILADQTEYIALAEASPDLPEPYGWSVAVKLDSERFFLIRPNDPEDASPGPGYYYYKIDIVDVTQGKSVQEYRLDSVA